MAEEKDNIIKPKRVLPESDVTNKAADAKSALERAVAASKDLAAKAAAERAAQVKHGVVVVNSLRVRKEHHTTSEVVAGLVNGDKVTVYETWIDGQNTWVRVGTDQWAAMVFEGATYIKLSE